MKRVFLGLAATLAAITAAPSFAQDAKEAALIAQAAGRGALIYAYDQAAWHSTDDLRAKVGDPGAFDVGGWIVEGTASAPKVTFFDKAGTHAAYTAQFKGARLASATPFEQGKRPELNASQLTQIAARITAAKQLAKSDIRRCGTAPFNTVVLPPQAAGEPTLVYFLTPQTKAGEFPIGGHYLVPVDTAGNAGSVRPFTHACMVQAPPKNAAAMMLSHVIDPVPTEIHAFTALAAKMPVYVTTSQNDLLWKAQSAGAGVRIERVEQSKK